MSAPECVRDATNLSISKRDVTYVEDDDYQNISPSESMPPKKRHKCPYCSEDFTRHHNLTSHLLTHNQEKPFVCQICQARFRRLDELLNHETMHLRKQPHVCQQCGRLFVDGYALARHKTDPGGCAGRRSEEDTTSNENDIATALQNFCVPDVESSQLHLSTELSRGRTQASSVRRRDSSASSVRSMIDERMRMAEKERSSRPTSPAPPTSPFRSGSPFEREYSSSYQDAQSRSTRLLASGYYNHRREDHGSLQEIGDFRCRHIGPSTGNPCNTTLSGLDDLLQHTRRAHNDHHRRFRCEKSASGTQPEIAFAGFDVSSAGFTQKLREVETPQEDFQGSNNRPFSEDATAMKPKGKPDGSPEKVRTPSLSRLHTLPAPMSAYEHAAGSEHADKEEEQVPNLDIVKQHTRPFERKRKGCDRCRLKVIKCREITRPDGSHSCARCEADSALCVFRVRTSHVDTRRGRSSTPGIHRRNSSSASVRSMADERMRMAENERATRPSSPAEPPSPLRSESPFALEYSRSQANDSFFPSQPL